MMAIYISSSRRRMMPLLVAVALGVAGCSDPSGQREFKAGVREFRRDNFVRAKSLLERSISRRPGHLDNAPAHNYLGMVAWRLGQYSEAMTAFEDSRRLNPNLVEPVYNMGALAIERDDARNAARFLNEAAALAPADPRPLELLADYYMTRQQWTLARNALYSALDREPQSARIYNAIATAHVGMGQPDQAIEALMLALEVNARFTPALFNLAVVFDAMIGDAEQAKAYYKRYLAAATQDGRASQVKAALARLDQTGTLKAAGIRAYPIAPTAAMDAAANTNEPDESSSAAEAPAETNTTVAAATEAPPPPVNTNSYESLLKQAEERVRLGQIQPALDLYERAAQAAAADRRVDLQESAYQQAVRAALDQPRAHAMLGQFYFDRGRYDQAARAFKQAATINADYAPAQMGLARLALRNNEADAALVHYRRVMAADPGAADAFWEFALLYDQQLELPENAAQAYRDFAARFPGDSRRTTALLRAEELAPTPRPDPRLARTASAPVSSPPEESGPRLDYRPPASRNTAAAIQAFNRASQHQERREWDRAIFFYLRALENDDTLSSIFYNLGICYTMSGDSAMAREAYRQALKRQPGLTNAKYNLALTYRESGDEATATRLLEELVASQPNYASAHHALGVIYAQSPSTYARAKQHYERFLALAPNDRSAPGIRQWLQQH